MSEVEEGRREGTLALICHPRGSLSATFLLLCLAAVLPRGCISCFGLCLTISLYLLTLPHLLLLPRHGFSGTSPNPPNLWHAKQGVPCDPTSISCAHTFYLTVWDRSINGYGYIHTSGYTRSITLLLSTQCLNIVVRPPIIFNPGLTGLLP